jgi:hypothetical protein
MMITFLLLCIVGLLGWIARGVGALVGLQKAALELQAATYKQRREQDGHLL